MRANGVLAMWLGYSKLYKCDGCRDTMSLRMGWAWADGAEDTYPQLDKWRESEPDPEDTHAILYKGEWVGVNASDGKYPFVCEQGRRTGGKYQSFAT
jgi:hypothetical protein